MKYLSRIFLKGLAAVLPISLTLYLVYWLAVSLELLLKSALLFILPQVWYWPGMGLIALLVLLFLAGLLVDAWAVRKLAQLGELILEKIPLIKSVYGGLRDFMNYFSRMKDEEGLRKVVAVQIGDARLIGFLTGSEKNTKLPVKTGLNELVSVYLPMSYQIGGFTVYVPGEHVEPIDLDVEDAMRLVLTAGLSNSDRSGK